MRRAVELPTPGGGSSLKYDGRTVKDFEFLGFL